MTKRDLTWKLAYLAIAGGVFMIDQIAKVWVTKSLRFGDDVSVISGFLNFTHARNPGVAFSMLDNLGDAGRWGLSFVAFVAMTIVVYFIWRTRRTETLTLTALSLLLAGIAGNVADRIRLGFVVDFIDVQFGSWHYDVFNIADAAICIGAVLLILDMFIKSRKGAAIQIPQSEIQPS
jgi:signal peptidase II